MGSEATHVIRLLYGQSVAKELLEAKVLPKNQKRKRLSVNDVELEGNNKESWTADALFTNANYQAKKMTFILFINRMLFLKALMRFSSTLDRLVESPRIKRAVESIYNGILPKGSFPFVYLRFISSIGIWPN